jgi:hypothetical protein
MPTIPEDSKGAAACRAHAYQYDRHRPRKKESAMTDEPANVKRSEPLSPTTQAVLSLIQGLLPAMTAIVGGLWIAFTYIEHQKDARDQASKQAAEAGQQAALNTAATQALANKELRYKLYEVYRPMLEKRDSDHYEMAQSVAKLLSNDVSNAEWTSAHIKFWEVYWGVSVLGLGTLHEKAKQFGDVMEKYKVSQDKETRSALEKGAAELSQELTRWIGTQKVDFLKRILTAPTDNEAISGSPTKM